MTRHIETRVGGIAETVLMPGDALQAKFIATNFLENVSQFNGDRGMLGFTGEYKDVPVSVLGSGLGVPSMGIYSYELYKFFDVENIIKVGMASGLAEGIELRDIVIAQAACTNSNFVKQYNLKGSFAPIADYELLNAAVKAAEVLDKKIKVGNALTTDAFYRDQTASVNCPMKNWQKMGVLAVDMETAGLYATSAWLGKKSLSVLTIADMVFTDDVVCPEEKQEHYTDIIKIALEAAVAVL
jgi:purine-nucleoside phosphorylase